MAWQHRITEALASPKVITLGLMAGLLSLVLGYTTQPLLMRGKALEGPAGDPARLEAHVRALVACGPRELIHPEALDAAATYIEGHLKASGGRVQRQAYAVRGRSVANLVARFGPEPTQGGPGLLVIGAHYDTCLGLPGADDNTSGVAVLLEVAGEHPPTSPVELVAWTLDEPPHFRTEEMGSRVHAKALKASGLPVRLVLSLEMLGTFDDTPGSQHYPLLGLDWIYPDKGNFLALVGGWGDGWKVRQTKAALSGGEIPIWSINAPSGIVGIDFSDHASYWKEGLPALMLTDTAFFRNRRYHTERDVADRLDYLRMANCAKRMISVVKGK
ncbi:MAG TPA: M28 family peptidase [Holophagaceae bacterium]|nr:M28 family peptidase [Holophagaceae bacterium]